MVIDTRLPGLLRSGRALKGMFIGTPVPALVEMAGHAGFDFVVVDNEHGNSTLESTEHLIRAAKGVGILPVVRTLEPAINHVLDLGASGMIVPAVNTAEKAKRIVDAAKYPPVGTRGAAFATRAGGFGFFGGEAQIKAANEGIAVMVMIETMEAIRNLDAILEVKGIDCAFVGPNDLSFSMGLAGQTTHQEVRTAVEGAIKRIRQKGVGAGVIANNNADAKRYRDVGANFISTVFTAVMVPAFKAAAEALTV
jgi:4-hydroxy-2-oxoheptanedioate aldolase